MKTITYYQFMRYDGGDRHYPKEPAFFNKEDADEFVRGNAYDHFDKKTVTIYDSLEEYEETKSEQVKGRALARLTEIEKRALGLI